MGEESLQSSHHALTRTDPDQTCLAQTFSRVVDHHQSPSRMTSLINRKIYNKTAGQAAGITRPAAHSEPRTRKREQEESSKSGRTSVCCSSKLASCKRPPWRDTSTPSLNLCPRSSSRGNLCCRSTSNRVRSRPSLRSRSARSGLRSRTSSTVGTCNLRVSGSCVETLPVPSCAGPRCRALLLIMPMAVLNSLQEIRLLPPSSAWTSSPVSRRRDLKPAPSSTEAPTRKPPTSEISTTPSTTRTYLTLKSLPSTTELKVIMVQVPSKMRQQARPFLQTMSQARCILSRTKFLPSIGASTQRRRGELTPLRRKDWRIESERSINVWTSTAS